MTGIVGRWPCDTYGGSSACGGGGGPSPPSPVGQSEWHQIPFSFADSEVLLAILGVGDFVLESRISIEVAFNSPLSEITLGPDADPDQFLTVPEVDPSAIGLYGSDHDVLVTVIDSVRVRISAFGATQGSGRAFLHILRAP